MSTLHRMTTSVKSEKEIKKYLNIIESEKAKPYDSENTVLIQELESILEVAGHLEKPDFENKKVYAKIKDTIKKEGVKPNSSNGKTKPIFKWISGVASIIFLVLIGTYFFSNDIQVDAGDQTLTYVLPDESIVFLDKNSSIHFKKNFLEARSINLVGEAFFEVKKGSKFSVSTPQGMVSVLGTSFNVYDKNGSFLVSCKTGKVRVDVNSKSFELAPGDQIRFSGDEVYEIKVEKLNSIDAWISGQPYFDSVPLYIVIDKLSNHFNKEILLPSKYRDLIFTGTYVTTDYKKALKMVLLPMELEYTIKPDGAVVF